MKVMMVLKHPNVDVVADIEDSALSDYNFGEVDFISSRNVFVVQWIDKYVKMVPFKAAKNLFMNISSENVAMMFEVDEKLSKIHEEEKQKAIPEFMSESEYQEMIRKNQEKVNKTLGK